jgi:hypothetical protein|tara:strand:+ start:1084 stop:1287 length:204 start_codon:yes stop_codon:yes gene_type:complete
MNYRGVQRYILNSEEFCFAYQGSIIVDALDKPLTLKRSTDEVKDEAWDLDFIKSEGFIDCLIVSGEI